MSMFTTFTESLKPLSQQVGRQWTQVQQFAKEKLSGNTADVTDLPPEYRQLEEKVDKVKTLHELFIKVSRNYTQPAYDYEPALNDKAIDFVNSVSSGASSLADKLSGGQLAQGASARNAGQETPPSLCHAFAKAAFLAGDLVNPEDPLATALKKFAVAEERMGNLRLKQDTDAVSKFHSVLINSLNVKINDALKARRNVQNLRLTYDACRARLKSAAPEKQEALRTEMEKSEDEFVVAVDDSMGKMKVVVENSEFVKSLADLVAIQLQYHKSMFETLSELSPEIDELVVTSEALAHANATQPH